MLKKITAQKKIASMTGRTRVVQGGTSAGKTFSIVPLLITYALQHEQLEISIVSESVPHLRRGAFRDFQKIMRSMHQYKEKSMNATNMIYTFQNGSYIEFFGADSADKLRGARRDILFLNEANNINFEAYQQLSIRTRLFEFIDFNPSHKFWAHEELRDASWVTLTYKDNEHTPNEVVEQLLRAKKKADEGSTYWINWVRVYVDGLLGELQGNVFTENKDWKQVPQIPEVAKLITYGLDFGYTNDPTSIIAIYKCEGKIYLHEEAYETRMTNADIERRIKERKQLTYVTGYADSAEPKSIAELRNSGIDVKATDKGRDSVMMGIQAMLSRAPIMVTQESLNLIKELRSYVYEENKHKLSADQVYKNKPVDLNNHAIDAARYGLIMTILKPQHKAAGNAGRRSQHKTNRL